MDRTTKDKRIQLRLEASSDVKIRAAAAVTHHGNRTAFVTEAALIHADRVLADRANFVLDEQEWAAFAVALDAAPTYDAGLDQLLNRESGFEASA